MEHTQVIYSKMKQKLNYLIASIKPVSGDSLPTLHQNYHHSNYRWETRTCFCSSSSGQDVSRACCNATRMLLLSRRPCTGTPSLPLYRKISIYSLEQVQWMASLEDMPPCQSPWKHCQKPLANRSPKFTEFKSQNKRAGDPMPRLHGDEIHQGRPGWSTTQVIWQK